MDKKEQIKTFEEHIAKCNQIITQAQNEAVKSIGKIELLQQQIAEEEKEAEAKQDKVED